jgi:hypothetical protein
MSGPDLGLALKKTRPDLHVMLMSGGENGHLVSCRESAGSQLRLGFHPKAFVATKLGQMVNDVLHSPDRSQLGGQEFDSRKDTH